MADEVRITDPSWKGAIILFIIGLASLIGQTKFGFSLFPRGSAPDLIFLVVLYMGLKFPLTKGMILAVILGLYRDAAGGCVLGMHGGLFLLVLLAAYLVRQRLDPAAYYYQMLFVLIFVLGGGFLIFLTLHVFGRPLKMMPSDWSSPTASFLTSAIFTSLLGPPVFKALEILTPKTDASEQEK